MTSIDYPRLCGGTFFTLILQDVKQRISAREHYKGESDGLNDPDILIGLITVINPDYVRPQKSLKTKTNDYKSCKHSKGQYLPFGNTPEIDEFDKRVKKDYSTALNDMTKFVEEYLEVGSSGKREYRLVKALLDLIQQDDTITDEDNDSMYVLPNGDALKKSQILELQEIHLPAFLLGVWHYCSTKRKNNKVGENTYNEWCPQKGGATRDYEGHMGETWQNQIKLVGVNQDGMYIANQDDVLCTDDEVEVETESTPQIVQEDKRYFEINSLGKNDKELLREFRNDYKKVMRFCIHQDPTAEPTPLSLADEIENLYSEKWKFEYLEIESSGLRQLVKEILITFNDYLVYLSDVYLRLMPDGKRLIFRNQSWEEGCRLREDMQPNTYKIRCRIAQLLEQLYPTVEETTPEVIVEEVVEEKVLQQTVNNPYVFNFTQNGDNNTQIGHVENYYANKKEE